MFLVRYITLFLLTVLVGLSKTALDDVFLGRSVDDVSYEEAMKYLNSLEIAKDDATAIFFLDHPSLQIALRAAKLLHGSSSPNSIRGFKEAYLPEGWFSGGEETKILHENLRFQILHNIVVAKNFEIESELRSEKWMEESTKIVEDFLSKEVSRRINPNRESLSSRLSKFQEREVVEGGAIEEKRKLPLWWYFIIFTVTIISFLIIKHSMAGGRMKGSKE